MNKNFLQETLQFLYDNNKTAADVIWIGNSETKIIHWDDFVKIADFEYYSGFGGNEINLDVIVSGKDWWLERHEYDGSQWWEFKQQPKEPKDNQFTLYHLLTQDE